MMKKALLKIAVPAVLAALVVLALAGCSNPSEGGSHTTYYTVTFDTRGATSEPPPNQQIASGGKVDPVGTPERDDDVFQDWYTELNALWDFDNDIVIRNMTLHATWEADTHEEQTEFEVILTAFDNTKKIELIKEVRAVTGLGLTEARDLVEGVPSLLKENVSQAEAATIKERITAAGGTVQVQ
jgi:ribosomal protein L7/L12